MPKFVRSVSSPKRRCDAISRASNHRPPLTSIYVYTYIYSNGFYCRLPNLGDGRPIFFSLPSPTLSLRFFARKLPPPARSFSPLPSVLFPQGKARVDAKKNGQTFRFCHLFRKRASSRGNFLPSDQPLYIYPIYIVYIYIKYSIYIYIEPYFRGQEERRKARRHRVFEKTTRKYRNSAKSRGINAFPPQYPRDSLSLSLSSITRGKVKGVAMPAGKTVRTGTRGCRKGRNGRPRYFLRPSGYSFAYALLSARIVCPEYLFVSRTEGEKKGREIYIRRSASGDDRIRLVDYSKSAGSILLEERNRKNIGLKRRDMVRRRGRKEREKGERGVNWWNERSRRAVICSRCFFAFRSTSSLSRATYVVAVRAKNKYSFSFFSFFFFPFFFF